LRWSFDSATGTNRQRMSGKPLQQEFLAFSTEFTSKPICTASRQYQDLKSKVFTEGKVSQHEMTEILEKIVSLKA